MSLTWGGRIRDPGWNGVLRGTFETTGCPIANGKRGRYAQDNSFYFVNNNFPCRMRDASCRSRQVRGRKCARSGGGDGSARPGPVFGPSGARGWMLLVYAQRSGRDDFGSASRRRRQTYLHCARVLKAAQGVRRSCLSKVSQVTLARLRSPQPNTGTPSLRSSPSGKGR